MNECLQLKNIEILTYWKQSTGNCAENMVTQEGYNIQYIYKDFEKSLPTYLIIEKLIVSLYVYNQAAEVFFYILNIKRARQQAKSEGFRFFKIGLDMKN